LYKTITDFSFPFIYWFEGSLTDTSYFHCIFFSSYHFF